MSSELEASPKKVTLSRGSWPPAACFFDLLEVEVEGGGTAADVEESYKEYKQSEPTKI